MTTLLFTNARNQIQGGTLNLASGTFYLHLVTAVPSISVTDVSQLSLATGPTYAPTILSGLSYASGVWNFSEALIPSYDNTGANIVGFVICKQAGGSPASTDVPIVFSLLQSDTGAYITLDPNNEQLKIKFNPAGILKAVNTYAYTCGAYATPFDTNGIIYKLGTKNDTQSYTNPNCVYTLYPNSTSIAELYSDRSQDNYSPIGGTYGRMLGLDFGASGGYNRQLRMGKLLIGIYESQGNPTFTIEGTNSVPSINNMYTSVGINWSPVGSFTVPSQNFGSIGWYLFTINDNNYWRYFRIFSNSGFVHLSEIEFYESTISTATLNLG